MVQESPQTGLPRIALFLPFLGWRGAQRVMLNLANGFAAEGIEVDLVLAEAKGALLAQIARRVRVIDLKSKRGVVRSLPAFRRYLRRERPDVLLTAMDYINVLSVVLRAVSSRRTRLFISCHTSLRHNAAGSNRLRDRFLPFAARMTYRYADRIIAVSGGVADSLAQITNLPRERIRVIYNPAIIPGFDEAVAEKILHPWFQPGEPPVVLSAGSLVHSKDFPTLLKAFALVRERKVSRLVILGEGEKLSSLQQLAADLGINADVAFLGWVQNPYPYMARSSVFASSSLWEGFGLVIAEALACGTPVVSTDCPSGPSEILEHGKYGTLVPVQDVASMADAIHGTLLKTADRAALQHRGRTFSLNSVVKAYLECIFSAISANHG